MTILHFGSRGGVYYMKNGRRVYVSNRFGANDGYNYDDKKQKEIYMDQFQKHLAEKILLDQIFMLKFYILGYRKLEQLFTSQEWGNFNKLHSFQSLMGDDQIEELLDTTFVHEDVIDNYFVHVFPEKAQDKEHINFLKFVTLFRRPDGTIRKPKKLKKKLEEKLVISKSNNTFIKKALTYIISLLYERIKWWVSVHLNNHCERFNKIVNEKLETLTPLEKVKFYLYYETNQKHKILLFIEELVFSVYNVIIKDIGFDYNSVNEFVEKSGYSEYVNVDKKTNEEIFQQIYERCVQPSIRKGLQNVPQNIHLMEKKKSISGDFDNLDDRWFLQYMKNMVDKYNTEHNNDIIDEVIKVYEKVLLMHEDDEDYQYIKQLITDKLPPKKSIKEFLIKFIKNNKIRKVKFYMQNDYNLIASILLGIDYVNNLIRN